MNIHKAVITLGLGAALMSLIVAAAPVRSEMVSAGACQSWMGETFFLLKRGETGYSAFLNQCVDKFKSVRFDSDCGGACTDLYQATFNVDERAFTEAFSEGCVKQCAVVAVKHSNPLALQ
jgi:hypothetical protein